MLESSFVRSGRLRNQGLRFLLPEPRGHVESTKFESQLDAARQSGFGLHSRPSVPRSHAAFLQVFPSRSSQFFSSPSISRLARSRISRIFAIFAESCDPRVAAFSAVFITSAAGRMTSAPSG